MPEGQWVANVHYSSKGHYSLCTASLGLLFTIVHSLLIKGGKRILSSVYVVATTRDSRWVTNVPPLLENNQKIFFSNMNPSQTVAALTFIFISVYGIC